jgi:hypothetical protein
MIADIAISQYFIIPVPHFLALVSHDHFVIDSLNFSAAANLRDMIMELSTKCMSLHWHS